MPRARYVSKTFRAETQTVIDSANAICAEYAQQGLVLTLRQLYYQFVARDLIANQHAEYTRLSRILSDARMAGVMDWNYLIDRTRNQITMPSWKSPSDMVTQAAEQYKIDLWANQKERVWVWVEKDAAIGVIEGICEGNDLPYFATRGYVSVSELWAAAQRVRYCIESGERVTILHIGDHDPSGIDMTRDIDERLRLFITKDWLSTWGVGLPRPVSVGDIKAHMRDHMRANGSFIRDDQAPWRVKRIALNIDQIQKYNPPPNPAKQADGRFEAYYEDTGLDESWELDALEPSVLQGIIMDEVNAIRNRAIWDADMARMDEDRANLKRVAEQWNKIRATVLNEKDI